MAPPCKRRRAERRASERAAAGGPHARRLNPALPEDAGDPDAHYTAAEAGRYSAQNGGVQADLATACLRFLGLGPSPATHSPPHRRLLLLDAGCGSGLSTAAAAALGHTLLGCDLSSAMLGAACGGNPATERACKGLVWRGDLGVVAPLRGSATGLFDGAISVSAIQWLIPSEGDAAAGTRRLDAFFTGLAASLVPGAGAVLQFYPRADPDATAVRAAADRAGFHAALFADVPHAKGGARKTFLGAVKERKVGGSAPAAWSPPPAADCPLCWPRAGTCGLWWARVGVPLLRRGRGASGSESDGGGGGPFAKAYAPLAAAAQRLVGEHASAGGRLARVVRRALPPPAPTETVATPRARLDAWVAGPAGRWAPCGAPLLVSVAGPAGAFGVAAAAAVASSTGRASPEAAARAADLLIRPAFPTQAVGGGPTLVGVVGPTPVAAEGASAVRAVELPPPRTGTSHPSTHLLLADGCARYVLARWEGVGVRDAAAGVVEGARRAGAAAAAVGVGQGDGGVYALLVDLVPAGGGAALAATITLAVHARNADGDEVSVAGLAGSMVREAC
jgi:18S rRNA (guanine1575-N7)-methyltransferase